MAATRSEDKWIALAREKGISPAFLKGVDLEDKTHKNTLYMKFGVSRDDVDHVVQQAELLAFVQEYRNELQQQQQHDDQQRLQQQQQEELSKQLAQLKDRQRKLEFQLLRTSMRLIAYNDDMLSDAFDQAQITTSFWLPTLQNAQSWTGLVQGCEQSYWDMYKIVDKERTKPKAFSPQRTSFKSHSQKQVLIP